MTHFRLRVFAALAFATGAALAQPSAAAAPPAPAPVLELQAHGMHGERFAPQQIRGRVALVFFWSTACAVCRDSLPELRANLMGWRNKPFTLVTVNVDRNAKDWLAYERILEKILVPPKGLIPLRQDEASPPPTRLPLTLLVDASGKMVARFEGRLAPEAWDGVADLLP